MIHAFKVKNHEIQLFVVYAIVVLLCVIDTLHLFRLADFPLDIIRVFTQPIEKSVAKVTQYPIQLVESAWNAHQTIQDLQRKNIELVALLGEADALRDQNQSLREELEKGSETRSQANAMKRRVVGSSYFINQQLEIDQGIKSGVEVGDVVLFHGLLIGQIEEVSEFFSRASLLQVGDLSISVQTTQGTTGLAELHEGVLKMRHIPSDQSLGVNDRIFSLGSYEHSIPPNLPVGTIQHIVEHQEQPTKEVIIDQGIDLRSVNTVVIEGF